jgi:hypothetical protein
MPKQVSLPLVPVPKLAKAFTKARKHFTKIAWSDLKTSGPGA